MYASGNRSIALGIDTKVVIKGKCNHPNIRSINKEYLKDGLPIPEFAWTHCNFYQNGNCLFGENCKYNMKN